MHISDNLIHAILAALLRELPEHRAQAVVDEWRAKHAASADRFLDHKIDKLEMSVRAENVLKNHGVETVRQMTEISLGELKQWKYVGKKTVREIREVLQNMGLDLRMDE